MKPRFRSLLEQRKPILAIESQCRRKWLRLHSAFFLLSVGRTEGCASNSWIYHGASIWLAREGTAVNQPIAQAPQNIKQCWEWTEKCTTTILEQEKENNVRCLNRIITTEKLCFYKAVPHESSFYWHILNAWLKTYPGITVYMKAKLHLVFKPNHLGFQCVSQFSFNNLPQRCCSMSILYLTSM